MILFVSGMGSTGANMITKNIQNKLQPQPEIDSSARVGMLAPTQVSKKVCQRLVEQVCNPDKEKNYFIMNNR